MFLGYDVRLAFFHVAGGDTPLGVINIDIRPLRIPQLFGPNERKQDETESEDGNERASIGVEFLQ